MTPEQYDEFIRLNKMILFLAICKWAQFVCILFGLYLAWISTTIAGFLLNVCIVTLASYFMYDIDIKLQHLKMLKVLILTNTNTNQEQ